MAADETVPVWVADLRVSVAEIKGRVEQIPEIARELEQLRAETVPMKEHLKLMNDVEELQKRDLGARSDWEDVKSRVLDPTGPLSTLMEDRSQVRGGLRATRVVVGILSVIVLILTTITLINGLGLSVHSSRP